MSVIPALVTPFDRAGDVDHDALHAHVGWLREQGIDTVSPLGTTGEGPSLSLRERLEVVERLSTQDVRLLPGTGATSLPETIELSRAALAAGADGILVAPPSYYPAERGGVVRYYDALLAALPDDARLFLYHVPAYTGVPIAVQDVIALRRDARVVGIKDSGGELAHTAALLRADPGLEVLSGSDATVADAFRAGAHGVVSALANVVPKLVQAVRDAVAAGGDGRPEQARLTRLREATKAVPQRAALKALVAAVTGLPAAAVRPPQAELEPEELEVLLHGFHAGRSMGNGKEQ